MVAKMDLAENSQVLEYMPMVIRVARRLRRRLPSHVEVEDLVQAGVIGLLDAFSKFDAAKKVKFSTYAAYRVLGTILDSLRELDWAPRTLRKFQGKFNEAANQLRGDLQREPTTEEVAERLGISLKVLREKMIFMSREPISLEQFNDNNEDGYLFTVDPPALESFSPDSIFTVSEMCALMDVAKDSLDPQSLLVIRLHYWEDMNMREIAELLGVCPSRISQIHGRALKQLRTAAGVIHMSQFIE